MGRLIFEIVAGAGFQVGVGGKGTPEEVALVAGDIAEELALVARFIVGEADAGGIVFQGIEEQVARLATANRLITVLITCL